ncbi:MAG TPA: hypothetical protein VHN74_02280 [Candidatus Angelobacter sp.]|jgi:hypothetical protein|nr:hypothetical protein [Candidatus Angelobacter sp.]
MSIKKFAKKLPGMPRLYSLYRRVVSLQSIDVDSLNQQLQNILFNQYTMLHATGSTPYARISDAGFRCYSQFEEDGIILYILSTIGFKTKKVVEMCCGTGDECMATNLILNHGFEGVLFDGDEWNIARANIFFSSKKDCLLTPPRLVRAWITKDNVNHLLRQNGAVGEVDLFSLDMDGNDYYIWEAISEINPRLCIFETHNIIPDDLSITIPYQPQFSSAVMSNHGQEFRSVSLLAMTKLSEKKGYRLIGAHKHGFNVLFLRNDIGLDVFPAVSIAEVHDNLWTRKGQGERWKRVEGMNWVEV